MQAVRTSCLRGRISRTERAARSTQHPATSTLNVAPSTQHPAPSTLRSARSTRHPGGYTFIELLVVSTIILILASAVMPLVKVTARRQHEAELRRALREMRTAIDKYKDAADLGQISPLDLRVGNENYPPSLETLVEGVTRPNDATGTKLKFLRRIPVDPMTHNTDWGLRSYQDDADATSWGGNNVFDVYTKFEGTALDGTKYRDW